MPIEYILGLISFLTSVVAGVLGFGGGMLLIAILPLYLHPSTVIPIHGITQLASNSSRMLFSIQDVQWSLLPQFLIGSFVGITLFGFLLVNMPNTYIPIAIGTYILLNLWNARFSTAIKKYESYYIIGLVQTGLGIIVGATGPIATSVLTKQLSCKNQIIATSSMFMSISHIAKIIVFGFIGFSFFEHISLLIYMIVGSVIGSLVGTKLRGLASNSRLLFAIKLLLSLLAIKMIFSVFVI
ncbi:sulfite exporter TauE/SafE family protein [Moritella sp. 24]|uniref:sulfite exporter TauE/SafE family protein n=1 Tax=Moritella sp. 24 TaxID=2746230 RepID=UPI001BA4F97B|nr:sulfite exporter TauE/SafE family protein [Moritella sp. 24]QUM76250.1 sulfite exporter TauE/SafE family protein [Moritella sp. 24]